MNMSSLKEKSLLLGEQILLSLRIDPYQNEKKMKMAELSLLEVYLFTLNMNSSCHRNFS